MKKSIKRLLETIKDYRSGYPQPRSNENDYKSVASSSTDLFVPKTTDNSVEKYIQLVRRTRVRWNRLD